ncbi:MAG: polyprenyl synthetase family protein [Aquisalinus sp.]|nr:polyprenyl synthetase family protein [Aquisalinus sp.]
MQGSEASHKQAVDALIAGTPDPEKDLAASLSYTQGIIDRRLGLMIPPEKAPPARLHQAMRRTTLAPGKRFRPLLTILIAEAAGVQDMAIYDLGCTSELVHAASLILDDLPCMDDAVTRRNAPCAHIFYDESTAILTATALLNRAFGVVAGLKSFSAEQRIDVTDLLSECVGSNGLIAGQLMDLDNTNKGTSIENVERLNALKTGALIDYAVVAAAIVCDFDETKTAHLRRFSHNIGLAFQLMDDIKDRLMAAEDSDKDVNQDINKATILSITNDDKAKEMVRNYIAQSREGLAQSGLHSGGRIDALLDLQFAFLDA